MKLNDEIQLWLSRIADRSNLSPEDMEELESHLMDSIDHLKASGLREDEAFLIAVRRLGSENELISEWSDSFATKIWKNLGKPDTPPDQDIIKRENYLTAAMYLLIALASLLPSFIGEGMNDPRLLYPLNVSMMVVPFIALFYLGRNQIRKQSSVPGWWMVLLFMLLPLIVNTYPFKQNGQTLILTLIHIPVAVWMLLAFFRSDSLRMSVESRLDFIRFSGETLVYSVLVGLCTVVLTAFTIGLFNLFFDHLEKWFESWVFPLILTGTLFTGVLLVERKRSLVENFAPVLARIVAPVLLVVLTVFALLVIPNMSDLLIDREVLITMDAMLLGVILVTVYSVSTQSDLTPNRFDNWVNLSLVAVAMVINTIAMGAMVSRISEFGLSPNKLTALGANILLVGNLVILLVYFTRQIRGKGSATASLSMQSWYLVVYFLWMLIVGLGFPVFFGFE
ncbi:MAG: hypothetical protein HUU10_09885 [Bacteroidetes bacterium]|nr:hypothetical protein [Bacteroidota bacterium]